MPAIASAVGGAATGVPRRCRASLGRDKSPIVAPASAATFVNTGDSHTIFFDGYSDGVVSGLTSKLTLTFNGFTNSGTIDLAVAGNSLNVTNGLLVTVHPPAIASAESDALITQLTREAAGVWMPEPSPNLISQPALF